jgi:hypothetical protein
MSSGVPKVRIVRVKDKPQNWAAYDVSNDSLLGYCGRDGVITNPVGSTPMGMITEVIHTIDTRAPSQGVRRSFAAIAEGMGESADSASIPEIKWSLVKRKEVGIFVQVPVTVAEGTKPGYVCVVYEVTEARGEAVRTRVENGRACHMQLEGYVAFCSLFSTYAGYARDHDKKLHTEKSGKCFLAHELSHLGFMLEGNEARIETPKPPVPKKVRVETDMDVLERELAAAQIKAGVVPKKAAPAVHTRKAKKVRR